MGARVIAFYLQTHNTDTLLPARNLGGSILLLLARPTTDTLRGQTLFTKGCPSPKVLATLAPLDLLLGIR